MPARIAASVRRNGIGRCSEIQAVPSDISASAMVSQPFSSAKVSASASAASVPVANSAIDACKPGVLVMTELELNARGYRYPLLLEGCTACKACSQICPDFVFQVHKYEEPIVSHRPAPEHP